MTVRTEDGVATVDFNRPEVANSLDLEAWARLGDTFKILGNDDNVSVIILKGEGKHWCAGMDLTVLQSMASSVDAARPGAVDKMRTFIQGIQRNITAIAECPKPVLAAIHGGCIGGGVAIASACDLRYCTTNAYFVVKEIDFGIIADIGTLQRLPRVMAAGIAAELCYTGRKMLAGEALSTGFVNSVTSDRGELMRHVTELARTIATKDPLAIVGVKKQLAFSAGHDIQSGLDAVAEHSAKLMISRMS